MGVPQCSLHLSHSPLSSPHVRVWSEEAVKRELRPGVQAQIRGPETACPRAGKNKGCQNHRDTRIFVLTPPSLGTRGYSLGTLELLNRLAACPPEAAGQFPDSCGKKDPFPPSTLPSLSKKSPKTPKKVPHEGGQGERLRKAGGGSERSARRPLGREESHSLD